MERVWGSNLMVIYIYIFKVFWRKKPEITESAHVNYLTYCKGIIALKLATNSMVKTI